MLKVPYSFTVDRRALIIGGLAALALTSSPGLARSKRPTILFVCQFGSVKSAITRELFRKRAAERGFAVRAFSRGITPQAHLDPNLRTILTKEGINPDSDGLRKLQPKDLKRADITVLFDRLPDGMTAQAVRDWSDTGSFNQAYAVHRPGLLARIDSLIDELTKK